MSVCSRMRSGCGNRRSGRRERTADEIAADHRLVSCYFSNICSSGRRLCGRDHGKGPGYAFPPSPGRGEGPGFNFGYLPGGDHRIATQAETSVAAVEQGLRLLKPGGVMSLCIYSGGDTGFAEKEALLGYLKKLPSEAYTVILSPYYNRRGDPPLPVFVFRQK